MGDITVVLLPKNVVKRRCLAVGSLMSQPCWRRIEGRLQNGLFFGAQEALFASMWVQAQHRQARRAPKQARQRCLQPVGNGDDSSWRELPCDLGQGNVAGCQDHVQVGWLLFCSVCDRGLGSDISWVDIPWVDISWNEHPHRCWSLAAARPKVRCGRGMDNPPQRVASLLTGVVTKELLTALLYQPNTSFDACPSNGARSGVELSWEDRRQLIGRKINFFDMRRYGQ